MIKKNSSLINEKILANQILLIKSDGSKQMLDKNEAINLAKDKGLDLVQVSPKSSDPTVCKIIDYGKHIFEKKKNSTQAKSKVKKSTLKEIKFRPSTDVGDYNIKLKKIKSFILNGDKTKISVRFRGREILNSGLGLELLERIKNDVIDLAQVDQEPSLEGRQLLMVLSPQKKKN